VSKHHKHENTDTHIVQAVRSQVFLISKADISDYIGNEQVFETETF